MSESAKFDPKKYMIKVNKGKDYLEVKFRVHWLRGDKRDFGEGREWDIQTELLKLDLERGIAVIKADIYDDKGRHQSSGMKMEYQKNFFDFLEKAETGAIGRALAALGYGTLQCFDLEEGTAEGRICDAPISFQQDNQSNNGDNKKASTKQKSFIYSLMNNLEIDKNQVMKIFFDCTKREVKSTNDLTLQEASKVIEYLKEQTLIPKTSPLAEPLFTDEPEPIDGGPFVKLIPAGIPAGMIPQVKQKSQ